MKNFFTNCFHIRQTACVSDLNQLPSPRGASRPAMEDRLYRLFGSRVRALREEKNVTQDELAKRVDLSRTSITNIERGRQRVLLHQMVGIAQALDADPTELIPKPESKPALRDDVARVVATLKAETERSS
ncbi:MAG: helix-turn-helix transcriptional regulator [Hyphomicrobiales bacterium]|nr:helix-turn-helix transcriptional regulator [Hyphomicrobiales bacterium]MCC2106716.1 helix-turn-helix transcriptional regulator [Hyphomicrobiales bacterium]HRY01940.1 helix-turn-helix transcriptional regulator [Beijerinckiaceae bacterium]